MTLMNVIALHYIRGVDIAIHYFSEFDIALARFFIQRRNLR